MAVKIQYPGADHALKADLKTLSRMTGLMQRMSPGTDVKAMMDELIDRTEAELDYLGEADNQRAFAKAYAGDPDFVIPQGGGQRTEGDRVRMDRRCTAFAHRRRRRSGHPATMRRPNSPPSNSRRRCGWVAARRPASRQLLPHRRRPVRVLDFGAVGHYPDGLPPVVGPILRLARDKKYDELKELMVQADFIRASHVNKVSAADIETYLQSLYVDPLYTESFHFTRKWLQRAAGKATDVRGDVQTSRHLNVPKQYVMVFRVLAGCVGIAAQMDAEAPYRAIMEKWVPGVAD